MISRRYSPDNSRNRRAGRGACIAQLQQSIDGSLAIREAAIETDWDVSKTDPVVEALVTPGGRSVAFS